MEILLTENNAQVLPQGYQFRLLHAKELTTDIVECVHDFVDKYNSGEALLFVCSQLFITEGEKKPYTKTFEIDPEHEIMKLDFMIVDQDKGLNALKELERLMKERKVEFVTPEQSQQAKIDGLEVDSLNREE